MPQRAAIHLHPPIRRPGALPPTQRALAHHLWRTHGWHDIDEIVLELLHALWCLVGSQSLTRVDGREHMVAVDEGRDGVTPKALARRVLGLLSEQDAAGDGVQDAVAQRIELDADGHGDLREGWRRQLLHEGLHGRGVDLGVVGAGGEQGKGEDG